MTRTLTPSTGIFGKCQSFMLPDAITAQFGAPSVEEFENDFADYLYRLDRATKDSSRGQQDGEIANG